MEVTFKFSQRDPSASAPNTGLWSVRPGQFCPLFLIQRQRASLPSIQRSATPLGAQTASLCSNSAVTALSFRIDRKMFILEVLWDLRRLFGFDFFAGSG